MADNTSQALLEEIVNDNLSGSVALLFKASRLFEAFQKEQEKEAIAAEISMEKLWLICRQLLISQPIMAALFQLVDRLLWASERTDLPQHKFASACKAVPNFLQEVADRQQKIAGAFLAMVPNPCVLLTHSSSSSVREAVLLLHRAGRDFRIIVTESRPMLEGTRFAKFLASEGVTCSLVVDSLVFSLLTEVDCVVVGGDALGEGGLVNKAGTLGFAIAAKELGKPFWALVGREKFLPQGIALPIPERPSGEVLAEKVPGLSVINRYFDLTPMDYLTGVVTDLGLMRGEELKREILRFKPHRMLHSLSTR
jgi:translation initiation factor 2B subunit (eIF-2B alpha/beta/delta family)